MVGFFVFCFPTGLDGKNPKDRSFLPSRPSGWETKCRPTKKELKTENGRINNINFVLSFLWEVDGHPSFSQGLSYVFLPWPLFFYFALEASEGRQINQPWL
jgi:hypothetical protein|tara:strand:- start:937 stop:1239 length:303 start_codon:yes stop_codon:yes gene_type:complete